MSHYFRKLSTICANLLDADTKGKEPRVPHHRGFLIIEVEITHEIWHLWKTELSVKSSTENQTFVRLISKRLVESVIFATRGGITEPNKSQTEEVPHLHKSCCLKKARDPADKNTGMKRTSFDRNGSKHLGQQYIH